MLSFELKSIGIVTKVQISVRCVENDLSRGEKKRLDRSKPQWLNALQMVLLLASWISRAKRLCDATLYYAVLCSFIPCCAMLCSGMGWYDMVCCALRYWTILSYPILYYTALHCTLQYYAILYSTMLWYGIIFYDILWYDRLCAVYDMRCHRWKCTHQCYAILCYTILCYAVLQNAIQLIHN